MKKLLFLATLVALAGSCSKGSEEPTTPVSAAQMQFVIDTSKDTGLKYTLPIEGPLAGCRLTVDWGDNTAQTIDYSSSVAGRDRSHTYAERKAYTITITSSLTDPTRQQMPRFQEGLGFTAHAKMLTELKTPLLNMGTDLSHAFDKCRNLTRLPANLFEKQTLATNFISCFNSCFSLMEIPAELFAPATAATEFISCFVNCGSLTAIPAELFAHNPAATNFSSCFWGCIGLTQIPEGLFAHNPEVTNFSGCFFECSGLEAIPSGLFANNPKVTDFSGCFFECLALEAIPSGLFANNLRATDFSECFFDCLNTTLSATVFCDESADAKATRFKGVGEVNFSQCFENCGGNLVQGGTAPALWDYDYGTSQPNKHSCFSGVSNVSNADDIPFEWQGQL